MNTVKIQDTDDGQTVQLPNGFTLEGNEVYIKKIGRTILLIPKSDPWESVAGSLDQFSDDFMNKREQPSMKTGSNVSSSNFKNI